jgi:hypothetical protein
MPSLLESLTEPNTGADLTRAQAFLTFLSERLSADDYQTGVAKLWAAISPVEAARQHRAAGD